jgi:hypothetical protein
VESASSALICDKGFRVFQSPGPPNRPVLPGWGRITRDVGDPGDDPISSPHLFQLLLQTKPFIQFDPRVTQA